MDVSIIIINYNTYDLTCKCISSILEYTLDLGYEIIVLDNASSECNPNLFLERFPKIKLIVSKENLGFSKGNNLAIEQAIGNVLLLLNSDTMLVENTIAICRAELLKLENCGVITCKLLYPNSKVQKNCQSFPSVLKLVSERLRLHKFFSASLRSKIWQGGYWNYEADGSPDWVWGTFFMFPKAVLNQLPNHKLNDDFFMYVEDIQWCWDIRKAGYTIYYTAKTSILHHLGASASDRNNLFKSNFMAFLTNNYSSISKGVIAKLLKVN